MIPCGWLKIPITIKIKTDKLSAANETAIDKFFDEIKSIDPKCPNHGSQDSYILISYNKNVNIDYYTIVYDYFDKACPEYPKLYVTLKCNFDEYMDHYSYIRSLGNFGRSDYDFGMGYI